MELTGASGGTSAALSTELLLQMFLALVFSVACLQSEFCAKDFFEPRIFLQKMLRNFPRNF